MAPLVIWAKERWSSLTGRMGLAWNRLGHPSHIPYVPRHNPSQLQEELAQTLHAGRTRSDVACGISVSLGKLVECADNGDRYVPPSGVDRSVVPGATATVANAATAQPRAKRVNFNHRRIVLAFRRTASDISASERTPTSRLPSVYRSPLGGGRFVILVRRLKPAATYWTPCSRLVATATMPARPSVFQLRM